MAPRDHSRVPGQGPTAPRRRSPRRPSPLARAASPLPVLLLTLAACTEAPPPEVEVDPVQAAPAAAVPAPTDTASPASPAPTTPPGPADPGAPTRSSLQQPPSPTTIDSLTARLAEIAAAQQLILTRLDSLQSAASPAATTSSTTPQQPPDSAAGLELPDLEAATEDVRSIGLGIALSLLVILVFHFLIRALIWVLETLAERSTARRLTIKWLIPITRMVLWAIAAFLIVNNVFRVDAQGIIAASAALGLAVGIAAQDVLKNVLGGLLVVFDQPFQVGDKITVGGTYGEVTSIGLRSTRIMTADDDLVTIPNSQVVEEQVANTNAGQLNCQVATNLHLPGRVDERLAKKIAFEAAVTSKYVFLNKPIVVLVQDDFRTTFVTRIKVRAYVLDPRFEFLFQSDVTERARDGFRKAGLMPERDWYPMVEGDGVEAAEAGSG